MVIYGKELMKEYLRNSIKNYCGLIPYCPNIGQDTLLNPLYKED